MTHRLTVARVDDATEREARSRLGRHDERVYSFVDATSFAVVGRERLGEAMAFDGHFSAAGSVEVGRKADRSLRPCLIAAMDGIRYLSRPGTDEVQTWLAMTEPTTTTHAPIILVPGFWLGAWAWDEVAGLLRADGHQVTALTLPGLESVEADRSAIHLSDHVDAICAALLAAPAPAVLAVHSAAGFSGYAASDRLPERIAAMVYVDTAPGKGVLDADFTAVDKPLDWGSIEAEENLDGLTGEQKETFRRRAVPEPGALLREAIDLTNDARRDIPSTFICTGFTSEQYQQYAREHPEWAFLAGIAELRDVTWIDLPTSHWPMWSRPRELATIIGDVANAHGRVRA